MDFISGYTILMYHTSLASLEPLYHSDHWSFSQVGCNFGK